MTNRDGATNIKRAEGQEQGMPNEEVLSEAVKSINWSQEDKDNFISQFIKEYQKPKLIVA